MEQIIGWDIYLSLGSFPFFEGFVKYIAESFEYLHCYSTINISVMYVPFPGAWHDFVLS